ncbi:MAG: hypothetical protein ACLPSY_05775 [Steroidobacteraceae bacterium]
MLDHDQIHRVLEFSQFRLKLIEFLKLPLNVSETALRAMIKGISPNVYRNYLARAARVEDDLDATVRLPIISLNGEAR